MAAEKKKERAYKVFLETGDGKANRTMEVVAESPDKAKRIAQRNAEDIASTEGGEPYEVVSCEAV